jgi:hypothetical protein
MGTRDRYEPGTFSWVELATSDAGAARRFYGELFGWDFEDSEIPDGGTYTMVKLQDRYVAGLMASEQPPHWNSYISVDSVDEAVERAKGAGGQALDPFDVMGAGRMAVITDPTGAPVCLWEPKDHPGAGVVNVPGSLTWNDLMTSDVGKAAEFYCDVFGWEVAEVEGAPGERVVIRNGDRMNGGMASLPEGAGGAPPHWLPYFGVEDAGAAAERVKGLGGDVVAGPIDVPSGRFALCADPQGAVFAIFAGEFDD